MDMINNKMKEFFYKKFKDKIECENFDEYDFVYAIGTGVNALLYSSLFMPEVSIIEDSVLLHENISSEECINRFLKAKTRGEPLDKIESSFNFVEVGYLFSSSGRDTSDEEDELLAYRIRDAWEGWLKVKFPEREFVVEVLSPEETGSCVGVHFFQKR